MEGKKKAAFWKKGGLKKKKQPHWRMHELGRIKISKIWCQETQKDVLQFTQLWHDIHL